MGWALRPKPKLIQTKPNYVLQISLISLPSLSPKHQRNPELADDKSEFFFPLQFGNEGHTQEIVCSSGTRISDENHLGFADTGRPLRVVDGSPVTSFFSWFSVLYRRWFRKIGSDLIWVSGVVSERVPKLEKERPY